jgi:hypothetical protein
MTVYRGWTHRSRRPTNTVQLALQIRAQPQELAGLPLLGG